jgi:hypothetical protein
MWLSKKRTKTSTGVSAVSDKLAGKIAGSILKMQTSFSNQMNQLFKKMSIKKIKLILISFCFVIGGYSVLLIIEGLIKDDYKPDGFNGSKQKLSIHFKSGNSQIVDPAKYINEETFRKIEQFKNYMDSLKKQNGYLYDSIIKARPLLLDSVLKLEEIYFSQNQK